MYFVSALPFEVFVLLFSGLSLFLLFSIIYYRKRLSKTHKGMYIAATCLGFAVVGLRIGFETGLLSNSVFFRALIVTVVAFLVAFLPYGFLEGWTSTSLLCFVYPLVDTCLWRMLREVSYPS